MTPSLKTVSQSLAAQSVPRALDQVLHALCLACQTTSDLVRQGAFDGTLGGAGAVNVQGEDQKALDVLANDAFVAQLKPLGQVAALVSEEIEAVTWLKSAPEAGDFIVYFDPLDGSSNLELNMTVGSIFSVVQLDAPAPPTDATVLRAGRHQAAAGYAIFGPSTMLVLTTGQGVDGYTLHPQDREFYLTHPALTVPPTTSEFAINVSRQRLWDQPIRRYVDECLQGPDGPRGRAFNMRWIASMVAEVHRILMRGGLFCYPCDAGTRDKGGRLRLMYEASPMAMIMEQAGGAGSTGMQALLDVAPDGPHQRVPVILGARDEVALLDSYHSQAPDT